MIKLVLGQPKWLVSLIILIVAALLIVSCAPLNQPPVISSLTANEEETNPGGSCQIECTASDPDEDELSYIWSADGGNISGEGSIVTWTAPDEPGTYTITVQVTDGRDGEETKQITINAVAPNHPPTIESLTPEWSSVRKAATPTIECVASDPDGDKLTYTWSADGGNFSGEGSTVTWVAPNAYGNYTITVTVTDGRGGEASESTKITVCSCPGAGG